MDQTTKTRRTSNKNSSSRNGSNPKDDLSILNSSISIAKGMLATLSTNDPSAWTRKCQTKMAREHTRILLQEVMEEIWRADEVLANLMSQQPKRSLNLN